MVEYQSLQISILWVLNHQLNIRQLLGSGDAIQTQDDVSFEFAFNQALYLGIDELSELQLRCQENSSEWTRIEDAIFSLRNRNSLKNNLEQ